MTADKVLTTHTGERNTTAPLHQLRMPVLAVCTRPPFHFLKRTQKQSTQKKGGGQNHHQHMHTAHSARTANKRHVAAGTAHDTERACAPLNRRQVGKDTAHAHAPSAAQGQDKTVYTPRAGRTGANPPTHQASGRSGTARLHRGPWQTSSGGMKATDDRRAGTQPRRGPPAKQRGPATGATGVRRLYRRLAAAIPPLVRDTPHGWAAPRAAAHRRGYVTVATDTCRDNLPPGKPGPGGRKTAFQSTCGSCSRGT